MPDIISKLLPKIKSHRLSDIDLGDEFIYPNYDGLSILNIPSSICQLLNIPPVGAPPLASDILSPLGDGIRKVILILMDALSLHRLQEWMSDEKDMIWNHLLEDGLLAPLTSISPSTTSAALTSLWTGHSPAQHGIAGYEQWLKEYGIVANMIEHKPITYRGGVGSLSQAGFSPDTFLPVPTINDHLRKHSVAQYAFQHYSIIRSGLSQMFLEKNNRRSFSTPADLWVSIRNLFEQTPDERKYVWAYWSPVDGLPHTYGPDDERPKAEFNIFSTAFERFFLKELSAAGRKETLVILTADHGQIATPKHETHYDLRDHPDFTNLLHILPTGENRMAYLHIKPGQTEAVKEYIEKTWPEQFVLIESAFALEKGLLGPGKPYERMSDRIGDLIAFARGDAYWWWAAKDNPMIGRHGGLSPEEMLVPFFAVRL